MLAGLKKRALAIIIQNITFQYSITLLSVHPNALAIKSERARLYIQNISPIVRARAYIWDIILLFALQALSNRYETSRVGGERTDGSQMKICARFRFLLADHQQWENRDARFDCGKESGLLQNLSAGQAEKPNLWDTRLLFILHTFRICNAGNWPQFSANDNNRLSHPASHILARTKNRFTLGRHQFWAPLLTNDYERQKAEMKWKFISRAT